MFGLQFKTPTWFADASSEEQIFVRGEGQRTGFQSWMYRARLASCAVSGKGAGDVVLTLVVTEEEALIEPSFGAFRATA